MGTVRGEDAGRTICLDDMHVLDTRKRIWMPIRCSLAPLPRKGHTLTSVVIEKQSALLVFGGYSIESVAVSNSVLVCDVDSIIKYVEMSQHIFTTTNIMPTASTPALGGQTTVGGSEVSRGRSWSAGGGIAELSSTQVAATAMREADLRPVVFRTVQCGGTPPSGRYRHSATLVPGPYDTNLLVIIGGIGADPTVSLSDVHILNVDTLQWAPLQLGSDALARGIGGYGPSAGIYGHTAFAIAKPIADSTNDTQNDDTVGKWEVLVFGGSSQSQSATKKCYSGIFAFDVSSHDWRRGHTGHLFPPSRVGHSLAIVPGFMPCNDLPSTSRKNSLDTNINASIVAAAQSAAASFNQMGSTDNVDSNTTRQSFRRQQLPLIRSSLTFSTTNFQTSLSSEPVCAIIFGGQGAVPITSEAWALDLQWRTSGVDQFYDSAGQQVAYTMGSFEDIGGGGEMTMEEENWMIQGGNMGETSQEMFTSRPGSRIQLRNNLRYLQKSFSQTAVLGNTSSGIAIENSLRTSESVPAFLETGSSNAWPRVASRSFDAAVNNEAEISEAVHRVRRERAQVEIQLRQERERCLSHEQTIADLTSQVAELKQVAQITEDGHNREIQELRELFAASMRREQELRELNQEAYALLTLYGIECLSSPNP